MSWLSGLAGKAEELLNKVDQTAAVSLRETRAVTPKPAIQPDYFSEWESMQARSSSPSAFSSNPKTSQQVHQPAASVPSTLASRLSKKDLDAELLQLLNNDTKKKLVHSRQSSNGSALTPDSGLHFTARPHTPPDDSPTEIQSSVPSDYEVVDSSSIVAESGSSAFHHADTGHKALELENSLLKNEIAALNSEMATLIRRTKQSEQELATTKRHHQTNNDRISTLEQLLRELNDKDTDQSEALKARDGQVAVLRVRLEEMEQELASKSRRLAELQAERSRILDDHTSSSGLHSQALDSLKVKLAETEHHLGTCQEQAQRSQKEFTERMSRMETDQQALSERVMQLQKKLTEEKRRNESLDQQIKHAKANTEHSKHELAEYKEKAARILQSKDRLIASMRESSVNCGELSASVVNAEITELEQERTLLRQEIQESSAIIESLRVEVQDLETQLQTDSEEARDAISSLEERLAKESTRCKDMEQELVKKEEELKYGQDQLVSLRASLQTQITDREREIEKLRNQLLSKKLSTATEVELESRLHTLTESLIQKQSLVESLSTEKNSLRLQLERADTRLKEMESSAQRSSNTRVFLSEEEGVRQRGQLPGFMKESPTDIEFTRKVKRAANSIDMFSIRLGAFLRRYPIARVFVILYMLLLHLWVMIVLLTYQPEMHQHDSLKGPADT